VWVDGRRDGDVSPLFENSPRLPPTGVAETRRYSTPRARGTTPRGAHPGVTETSGANPGLQAGKDVNFPSVRFVVKMSDSTAGVTNREGYPRAWTPRLVDPHATPCNQSGHASRGNPRSRSVSQSAIPNRESRRQRDSASQRSQKAVFLRAVAAICPAQGLFQADPIDFGTVARSRLLRPAGTAA